MLEQARFVDWAESESDCELNLSRRSARNSTDLDLEMNKKRRLPLFQVDTSSSFKNEAQFPSINYGYYLSHNPYFLMSYSISEHYVSYLLMEIKIPVRALEDVRCPLQHGNPIFANFFYGSTTIFI